jgi:hypothetical protein
MDQIRDESVESERLNLTLFSTFDRDRMNFNETSALYLPDA